MSRWLFTTEKLDDAPESSACVCGLAACYQITVPLQETNESTLLEGMVPPTDKHRFCVQCMLAHNWQSLVNDGVTPEEIRLALGKFLGTIGPSGKSPMVQ